MNDDLRKVRADIFDKCRRMTREELEEFLTSALRISAWSQQVFIQRFGLEAWAEWNRRVEQREIEV